MRSSSVEGCQVTNGVVGYYVVDSCYMFAISSVNLLTNTPVGFGGAGTAAIAKLVLLF